LTSPRLERAIKAAHRRNTDRPVIDLSVFDANAIRSDKVREAVVFLLGNLFFTEGAGAANLAHLARNTPIGALRSAYGAQISDEVAHAEILRRYLVDCLGVTELREHTVSVAGRRLGMLVQNHPLVGVESVTLPIEFYAFNLLECLLNVVDEPALRASLSQIRQDEGRHMVVTTEAVTLLERAGIGTNAFMRARRKLTRAAAAWFTKRIYNDALEKHCGVLGIAWNQVHDKSMDEIALALARAEDRELGALPLPDGLEGDAE